jgi:two-component system response regulator (stage 0 sporulation protein F)
MNSLKILVVDDDDTICTLLREILTREGHLVTTQNDPDLALGSARSQDFDLVLLDIRMPKTNGVEVLKRMHPLLPNARFVMITGSAADDLVGETFSAGATLCLSKPIDLQQVKEVLSLLFSRA